MKTTQNIDSTLIEMSAYQAEAEASIKRNMALVKVALAFFVVVLNVCCFQLFF